MLKLPVFIISVFLIASCTQPVSDKTNATIVSSPTPKATQDYMQNLILENIRSSFSVSPHAMKFTCNKCHSTLGDSVEKELIWFEDTAQQEVILSSSSELCSKCHPAQNMIGWADSITAHPDFECTTCHQPHSTQASCTQSACHSNILAIQNATIEVPEYHPTSGSADSSLYCAGSACHDLAKQVLASPIYHQPVHHQVPCYVCHDVSGLPIVSNANGSWFTIADGLSDADSAIEVIVSHQIGREVDCSKCHYTDNPWELVEHLSSN